MSTSPRALDVSLANGAFGARVLLCAVVSLAVALGAAAQDAMFQGKVLDPKGKGVEGAKVTLEKADDPTVTVSVTTDKKGGYRLSIADSGEFVLRAEKAGFGPAERLATVEPGLQYGDANLQLLDEATWRQNEAVEAFNAGVKALQAGREEEALANFDAALETNPELAHAHYARAAALHGLARWKDAAQAVDQYQQAQPDDTRPELYQLAFEVYFEAGQSEKAEQALAKITDPAARAGLAPRIYNSGVDRNRQEDFDGAIAMFKKAAELDPSFSQAHQNAAAIEFNRQKYEAALVHLDQLLTANPGSVEGLRMRFYAYRALDEDRAKSALEAYLAQAPAAGEEVAEIAGDDFDRGDTAAATKTLQALVEVKPDVAVAHYHLGRALASTGANAGAKTHLQHFIQMAPSHPDAAAAKAMMAEL
ncbi:MAG TPA: tetratricopeptide repeat protein [Thermoanaerobaculia bacterium]|nr:tetratricopeptide repeat protein [Thermoanaerobaculia bacterium]